MLVNSISNRALRSDLAQEFAGLGYVASDSNPDFCVAYYASTNQKLDVTYWDYGDRKSTRLNSSHLVISYAVFCLKKKKALDSITLHRSEHGDRSHDAAVRRTHRR